jgi:DNA-binding CsgD family transcriptional regulator/N-acetylneuraminic acid mutarotase
MPEYGEVLSDREQEILRMVATGITNREIAYRLSISVNTVKVHLRNVFTKLGAESRTEATMIAVREGWVVVEGAEEAPQGDAQVAAPGEVTPVTPGPPLPWFKRLALIAGPLIAVAGIAVTWPQTGLEINGAPGLPPVPTSEQRPPLLIEASESSWHEKAQMPTRRAFLGLAPVEGRIFAIAGQTPEGVTSAVEIYDPQDDIWTRGSDKPTPVTYVSAAAIGTDVYVPGGCDAGGTPTQVVEVYDTQADTWRAVSSLPDPRCAYALAAQDGKLYLFGGWDGKRYVPTSYVYDPHADVWTDVAPMDAERGFSAAAALDERLYVVGGHDGERELTTCAYYDPATETWTACAPLTVGRGELGLVNLGGQLYAIGGGGWTSYLGFSERYNPTDDTWSAIETPLVGEWRSPGVTAFETIIYAVGGWSSDYLSLNQAYDPLPFRIFIPVSPKQ